VHSASTWLREFGRKIKECEKKKPLKTVKYGKNQVETPLYEEDQTEAAAIASVRDNQIPTNEFGNVELLGKAQRIPKGTVHIKVDEAKFLTNNSLYKAAKRLDAPFACVVIGFDRQGRGRSAKVTSLRDGIVVVKGWEDTVIKKAQELAEVDAKYERERAEERAKTLWRLLLKSLIVRRRVDAKFEKSARQRLG